MLTPSRLAVARKRQGRTLTRLAELTGISTHSLSVYENGHQIPGPATLDKLARALDVSVSFLSGDDIDEIPPGAVSFRALSKMTARQRDRALAGGRVALLINDWIEARFRLPDPDIPTLTGHDPEAAAEIVRARWGLGERPVRNMLHVLEAHGTRIYSLTGPNDDLDAYSLYWDGKPFVFLSTGKTGERGRFDAAHELGHLVLHGEHLLASQRPSGEAEANRFAAAFLMPRASVLAAGLANASVDRILVAKAQWDVAAMALTHRLHELELLTDWGYRAACVQLGRLGYRRAEPSGIPRETSQLLGKVLTQLRAEGMTPPRIAASVGISVAELRSHVFGLTLTAVSLGMTSFSSADLEGLPDLLSPLLTSAPVTRPKLLELSMTWTGLPSAQAAMARGLRVFVVTWDPLETSQPRPLAVGTTNAGPVEVVVYVPLWSLASAGRPVFTTLGSLGAAAVVAAAEHAEAVTGGAYPGLVASGSLPDLLGAAGLTGSPDLPDLLGLLGLLGLPDRITAVNGRWEDIGLGAITDFVQQAYGPVDLDRSLVELAPAGASRPGCPACQGERFGFIAELMEASQLMCGPHRSAADAVRRSRFARAEVSNPDGWWAIADASARLSEPHLPLGLYARLVAATDAASRAAVVVEAARWFPGQQGSFVRALGSPDWLTVLIRDLGVAGLPAEAIRTGEALTGVNPALAGRHAGEVAVALADAGQAADARAVLDENVRRWPDDFWVRLYAGEALEMLGESSAALAEYEEARRIGAFADRHHAAAQIRRLTGTPEPTVQRHPRRATKRRH